MPRLRHRRLWNCLSDRLTETVRSHRWPAGLSAADLERVRLAVNWAHAHAAKAGTRLDWRRCVAEVDEVRGFTFRKPDGERVNAPAYIVRLVDGKTTREVAVPDWPDLRGVYEVIQ